jgi:hypothetical protein
MQVSGETLFVKDKVIPNMPYCSENGAYAHSNVYFLRFNNTIKPIAKHMCNTQSGRYIKSHINNLPDNFCKRAFDKEVLYRLILITETTYSGALPIYF